jgi:hypothetical protein
MPVRRETYGSCTARGPEPPSITYRRGELPPTVGGSPRVDPSIDPLTPTVAA